MEGGKISLALGGTKKAPLPKPTNGVKRSYASLREDDDQEYDVDRPQKVSHFDKAAGGAIDESKPKVEGPLVIAPQANRDWREASKKRRQRNGLPPEAQNGEASGRVVADLEAKLGQPQFGLNVTKRNSDEEHCELVTTRRSPDDGQRMSNDRDAPGETEGTQKQAPGADGEASVEAKTDEEEAMDALLGRTKKSDLVLPAMNEEEAFSQDFRTAPDVASLHDYDRVPVEQFGAALLRGMGWKDGEGIGAQRGKKVAVTKMPERRPALLGIGAKEEAAVAQEMGSWGKAAKDRKGAPQVYNPVLLRDKKTGEMFTEEELQKKREREERDKYEEDFERKERKKRREVDGGDDNRDKRRDKDRRREKSTDRKRRDDGEEYSSRRKDKGRERARRRPDEGSDEDYYRRKETERRRRDRNHEREDSDHHRERSRKYDDDRERHRERDRRR